MGDDDAHLQAGNRDEGVEAPGRCGDGYPVLRRFASQPGPQHEGERDLHRLFAAGGTRRILVRIRGRRFAGSRREEPVEVPHRLHPAGYLPARIRRPPGREVRERRRDGHLRRSNRVFVGH